MQSDIQLSWPYDEANRVANKIVRKYRHEEEATFCLRCGGDLSSWGPVCRSCGTEWNRVFTTKCPTHDRTYVHLHAPMVVGIVRMGAKTFVQAADGFAFCEECGSPHLFRWSADGLVLVTLDGGAVTVPLEEVRSA